MRPPTRWLACGVFVLVFLLASVWARNGLLRKRSRQWNMLPRYLLPREVPRPEGSSHALQSRSSHGRRSARPCPGNRFACRDPPDCISKSWRCDGYSDCMDGSDERECAVSLCYSFEFQCVNGGCVLHHYRCDGYNDCGDESDESYQECGSCDAATQFTCKSNGRCIPRQWSCDGYRDCLDDSDENDCAPVMESTTQLPTTADKGPCDWSPWSQWTACTPGICYAERSNRTRACPCGNANCPPTEAAAPADLAAEFGDRQYTMCPLQNCPDEAESGCGTFSVSTSQLAPRIVGGETAQPGQWPWQVQLRSRDSGGQFRFVCGGTLVDWDMVVTAAHCFPGSRNSANWVAILGRHHLDSGGIELSVSAIVIHEGYSGGTSEHDLALLVLGGRAQASPAVNTACLDWTGTRAFGGTSNCYITGWGHTEYQGVVSEALQEANVPLIATDICSRQEVYGEMMFPTMQCAGYLEGGVDSCQGDSGGPLVCTHPGSTDGKARFYLVGVTSWGISCAEENHPGVYTKMADHTGWLRRQMDAHGTP